LNCGCIPTKFLWQALKTKQKIQKSSDYGFKATLEPFSFADIIAKKDKSITNIRKGMELILASYENITVVKGAASFKDKNTLIVKSASVVIPESSSPESAVNAGLPRDFVPRNDEKQVVADKIIIAAGTKPSAVKGFDFDGAKIINSTDVLNLKELPESVLVVGGGAIGIEMATVLSGFGVKVTIAEYEKQLLPSEDAEISAEITKNLQRQGVEVLTSCSNALEMTDKFEKILIVTGRTPDSGLNLEKAGIAVDKKGFVTTNEFCETNVKNIYVIGDIAGKYLLAYTAQNDGAVAAENAVLGNKVKADNSIVPMAVFSNPPAASVKVKDFADYEGLAFGKFPFTASGRAFIENERAGFVKCAVDKNTAKPLAFWIIGAHADEMINTAAAVLKSGCIGRESMFHPSLGEGLFNAYEDAFGKCTETTSKK
ncbi:MAG: NAD(P)/FAD-dependent oxidoreductase, partial [Endomicrobia bacterium]|nr:NAD(P)/FAD-dependent oxidoreductase [Endomicrobiia bacterium]